MLKHNLSKLILGSLMAVSLPLTLTHCSFRRQIPFPMAAQQPNVASVNTSNVDSVVLNGHMNIDMKTQYNNQHLTFKMPHSMAANSYIYIKDHTLYINNKNNHTIPGNYHLTIGRQLKNLTLAGNVSIHAKNLYTHALTIKDASGGLVSLNGQIDVQRIYASQQAHLDIGWVDSPLVVIYANDHAHIKLAGVTKESYIHMTGNSQLDAQYLRSGSVTIDSTANSIAKLFPINSFQGFAHQASTIYLFHNPQYKNSHTWDLANIFMKSYRP